MITKRVEGIGVVSPDDCKHDDLEDYGESALCSCCNALLPVKGSRDKIPDESPEDIPNVKISSWDTGPT